MTRSKKNYFQGIWIPKKVLDFVCDKTINLTEMAVLSMIESLTDDDGCTATNAYLAERIGVDVRTIQRSLAKLKTVGLLKVKTRRNARVMRTVWSEALRRVKGVTGVSWEGDRSVTPHSLSKDKELNRKVIKKKNRDESDANSQPQEEDMATFGRQTKRAKASEFDEQAARRLKTIIVEKRFIDRRVHINKWAHEFFLLRNELTRNAEQRITAALDFYEAHCKDKGVPRINDAKYFRKLFDWLEGLVEKQQPDIKISERAKKIAKSVLNNQWPCDPDDVERSVQQSLDAFEEFDAVLVKIKNRDDRLKYFIIHLRTQLGSAETFLAKWYDQSFQSVKNWKAWSGDIDMFTLRLDHKRFKHIGSSITRSYGREVRDWDNLVTEGLKQCG